MTTVTEVPAVLIVGPSWVGDMVLMHSLVQLLKRREPAPMIDVLAPPWSLPVLARMPEVRAAISNPCGHGDVKLGVRWRLGRRLRAAHYQQAIVLPGSLKSALIPWFAGIPRRTGYRGEWRWGLINDRRPLDKTRYPRTVDRFAALAADGAVSTAMTVPVPRLTADPDQGRRALRRLGVDIAALPAIAFCPGAEYGPAKRWPVAHFAVLAKHLSAQGVAVWLLGSAKDAAITAAIAAAAPHCMDLAGRTTLDEAIDILALSAAVVTNDSGLMHVAAAVDRPLIALFGSSDPRMTPPLSSRARVVQTHIECSPCFRRVCPLGHGRCLTELTPERVLDEIMALRLLPA